MAGEGAGSSAEADTDKIPEEWGWPAKPYDPGYLQNYVVNETEVSRQEKWDEALEARTVGGSKDDHLAEKAFANVLLDKEGSMDASKERAMKGIDPNAYKKGKWYRFLNKKGDCHVYIHNYTRDITATKPENYAELTEEEKRKLKKLGVFIKSLPEELENVYEKLKRIPIIFGSQEACEALKQFTVYAAGWQLLDATKLKRVNAKALEESRQAIVNAMKLGKWLCVYLGDDIPELQEKVCASKNRDFFPISVFQYRGLDNEMVRERIYKDEDKEGGQCVCRPGFRVCIVLMYDSMNFDMSSMRTAELPQKIPNFDSMEVVRTYNEADMAKALAS